MIDYSGHSIEDFLPHRFKMEMKRLVLKDFRGFNNLTIDFDEKLTVLIADNGGGKTSILDAAAEFLNFIVYTGIINVEKDIKFNTIKEIYEKETTSLGKKDVNNNTDASALAEIYLEVAYPIQFIERVFNERKEEEEVIHYQIEQGLLHLRLEINKASGEVRISIIEDEDENSIFLEDKEFDTAFFHELRKSAALFQKEDAIPVLAYYGGSAINIKIDDYTPLSNSQYIKKIYKKALKKDRFSFKQFFHFFKELRQNDLNNFEEIALKIANLSNLESNTPNTSHQKFLSDSYYSIQKAVDELKTLKEQAFASLLNSTILTVLNSQGEIYRNLNLDIRKSYENLTIEKKVVNDFITLELSQLSAGERNLLALTADIAMRMFLANPKSKNTDNPFLGDGIILIDEIDLHLHPKWQRQIIPKLREVFPNVQFVVSTHSAIVLQGIKGKAVTLSNSEIIKIQSQFGGWEIEELLEYMGLKEFKTPNYVREWMNFQEAYRKGNYKKANEAFLQIKDMRKDGDGVTASLRIQLESLKDDLI